MNYSTRSFASEPAAPGVEPMSLFGIGSVLLRNWRQIVLIPMALAIAVGAYTLTRDRPYFASAAFLPKTMDTRAVGGAAALAQQFGVNLAADRPGESPQFYLDLLRNRTILRQAVETEYEVVAPDGSTRRATLIQIYGAEAGGRPAWRDAVEELERNINATVTRETGVIRFTVTALQPPLAEQIATRLLALLNEFNMELRQGRAEEEGRFIAGRVREAEDDLLEAERALQSFLRRNREFRNSPDLSFEYDRLQRQVVMRQEVYSSLVRSQEQARVDAVRDTPLFSVIEHPAGTAEPGRRGTVSRTILAFLLGLAATLFLTFVREFGRRRGAVDPEYAEWQRSLHELWLDLRNPLRWFRRGRRPVSTGD